MTQDLFLDGSVPGTVYTAHRLSRGYISRGGVQDDKEGSQHGRSSK